MGTTPLGFDTDDASNALFSIYFHCERDVVTQALSSMRRDVADVPRDILPSTYRILPMPIAVQTLKSSNPHPEVLAFAISILTRSLPKTTDDVSSTPTGAHILDLVDTLGDALRRGAVPHRLSPPSSRLAQEFKDILGKVPQGGAADDRNASAYMALWGKKLGQYQLQIGSFVTRSHG